MSTIVVVVFATLLNQKDNDLEDADQRIEELVECGQDYVEASNAATLPIREAASQLDAADDRLWHAVQVIFNQQATPEDYREVRQAVKDRNALSDDLKEAREENPPPPQPETFCSDLALSASDGPIVVEAGGEQTPNCATHNEWDQVDVFMRPFRVEEIIGNNGWFIDTQSSDTFARGYNLCWTGNFGKVWYWQDSALSFRKDII